LCSFSYLGTKTTFASPGLAFKGYWFRAHNQFVVQLAKRAFLN
jgi:hypothetical protein